MRSLVFIAAVVVAGTWMGARHLLDGEARAEAIGSSAGVAANKEIRTQEIVSIAIDTPRAPRHERRLPLAELRSLLSSKPGELVDDEALEADRGALESALVARGYLAATVAPATVTFSKAGAAYVVFDVDRGPMFHLRSIEVTGPGEQDASVVRLSAGDEALPSRLERARQSLAEAIAARSSRSHVELHVTTDAETATVDVELATTAVTVQKTTLAPARPRLH